METSKIKIEIKLKVNLKSVVKLILKLKLKSKSKSIWEWKLKSILKLKFISEITLKLNFKKLKLTMHYKVQVKSLLYTNIERLKRI